MNLCSFYRNEGCYYLQIVLFTLVLVPWSYLNQCLLAIQQFFNFCEIMTFLLVLYFCQNPLRSSGLGCSATTEWTWTAFRFVCVAPFIVALRYFARNWGLPLAQKSWYASYLWRFLQDYCTKLYGHFRVLLALNPLLAVFSWFLKSAVLKSY